MEYNNKILKNYRRNLRKKQTESEAILWSKLRNRGLSGYRFIRQYSVNYYILDFYCPKCRLGIELDGEQHTYPELIKYDNERTVYLQSLDIKIIRFWNSEVMNYLDEVLDQIYNFLITREE